MDDTTDRSLVIEFDKREGFEMPDALADALDALARTLAGEADAEVAGFATGLDIGPSFDVLGRSSGFYNPKGPLQGKACVGGHDGENCGMVYLVW